MRKPKKRTYEQLRKVFEGYHADNGYCAPLAFAVHTGWSAGKALAVFDRLGRERQKGSAMEHVIQAYQTAGYKLTDSPLHTGRQYKTVMPELRDSKRDWLLIIGNSKVSHAVAIRSGDVVDWTKDDCRKKVLLAYEVTQKEQAA